VNAASILIAVMLAAQIAAAEEPATLESGSAAWMHGCSAFVRDSKGPPRYPFATITSVSVGCGNQESCVLRAAGRNPGLTVRWLKTNRLVVEVPAGTVVLWRATPTGDGELSVEYTPPLRASDVVYGELPRSQWPSSCASAAKHVIDGLPEESRQIIRQLSPSELRDLRLFWGAMLSQHLALYSGNSRLLESCGGAKALAGIDVVDLVAKELRK
jgi:hypothetical protein